MSENGRLDPRFMELASRFLDGEATPEELESLNDILQKDPLALETLGELLNQHGTLAWTQRGQASFKEGPLPGILPGTRERLEPARFWWIAIPLAACLLVTVAIVRFAPRGTLSTPKVNPIEAAPATPGWRTLSFQDGVFPSKEYSGTRNLRLMEKDSSEKRGSERLLEVDGEFDGRPALLKWNLREIPPGSRVLSVSLELTVSSVSRDREYEVHAVSRPWAEGQTNWFEYSPNRRWEIPGARGSQDKDSRALARFKPTRGSVTIPLNDVGLAAVQRWVNSADSNHGLLLQVTDRAGEFSFHSRDSETAAHRPKLTVSYYPALK